MKKPAGKTEGRKISFSERGWLAQIKAFQKEKDPHFYWASELLMKMVQTEDYAQKRALQALLDRKLKEFNQAGDEKAIKAVVGGFIAYGQEGLIRSTLNALELHAWAKRVPKAKGAQG